MTHLKPLLAQAPDDPWAAIAASTHRMQLRHRRIERRIGTRSIARRSVSPLAVPRARDVQEPTHAGDAERVAMLFDPGVSHRDSLTKYTAAFFTISRSSLALTNSLRSRAFSASNSDTGLFAAQADSAATGADPCRPVFRFRTQFVTVDCGTPSLLAAALPPIESASRTASTLNSSVYCRFGTDSFLLISSLRSSEPYQLLMYVKPRQDQFALLRLSGLALLTGSLES